MSATVNFAKSGWLAARRVASSGGEHYVHTAAVFVTVNNAPVRANTTDPQYFVNWMNDLLTNISPGGEWNHFFPTSLNAVQTRYQDALALYQQIASEAAGSAPTLTAIAISPSNAAMATGNQQSFPQLGFTRMEQLLTSLGKCGGARTFISLRGPQRSRTHGRPKPWPHYNFGNILGYGVKSRRVSPSVQLHS